MGDRPPQQIRAARLAERAAASGQPLPKAYHDALRLWFFIGWPAFIAVRSSSG